MSLNSFIPQSAIDKKDIMQELGINSIDELFHDVPDNLLNPDLDLEKGLDEISLTNDISKIAESNTYKKYTSFLGAGAYNHYIPQVVNDIISRSEFYTAYTPYQPEMSQGILQAIFEFQTMICELTGLDVSNASLYDGSTAIWEAILMSIRKTRRNNILVYNPINPNYKQVLDSYAKATDISISYIDNIKDSLTDDTASVIVQYPNFHGIVEDLTELGELINNNKSILICCANPTSLALFETPANMGAKIIVGEGQPLGMPLSFGGPYLGFMAASNDFLRQMPGRIVGKTKDIDGKTGYVLTIQTREQHIRREKATSNICSNQALMALAASVYLAYMGKTGLNKIAQICYTKCLDLKQKLDKIDGIKVNLDETNFNEFVIELSGNADEFIKKAMEHNIIPGYKIDTKRILVSVTEMLSDEDVHNFQSLSDSSPG